MSSHSIPKTLSSLSFIILSISVLLLVDALASGPLTDPERGQIRLTGAEDHSITFGEAQHLISNYLMTLEPGGVRSEMFGRDAIDRIMAQSGCRGLRIHHARKDDGTQVLVLMGVDQYGVDLAFGELAERGILCPPICDTIDVDLP